MYSSPPRRSPRRNQPLPVISEDKQSLDIPPVPPRAWNRPVLSRQNWLRPMPRLYEADPPAYTYLDPDAKERGALSEIRNNTQIARRGGWKKLALLIIILLLCVMGLVVGLVVGLRKRSQDSSHGYDEAPASTPDVNTTFPSGSYRISTVLSTVATNCISNPAIWRCYPYSTYSESATASETEFDWIISPVPYTSNYTLSSTPNIFALEITNASLTLQSAGTEDENYYFAILSTKVTIPTVALGSGNEAATCSFANTIVEGRLYTKKPKTYPGGNVTAASTDWPFAVSVAQIANGGPSCVDANGTLLGDFSVEDEESCQCFYQNTGTS